MIWIIKLVLLGVLIGQTLCCSCYRPHIQNSFCESDIVIRGMPVERTFSEDEISNSDNPDIKPLIRPLHEIDVIYTVYVSEVFKAPKDSGIKEGSVIKAVTGASSGMCGGYLWIDHELLITGSWDSPGQLGFSSCSYKKLFADLTSFQVDNLRASYDCSCIVKNHPRPYDKVNNNQYCMMPYSNRCFYKYGGCRKTEDGCDWDVDPDNNCKINN